MLMTRQQIMELVNNVCNVDGTVDLPESVLRGFNHLRIADEVYNAVKELNLDGESYTKMKNKVSLYLERNDQQVGYYLYELKKNGKITYTHESSNPLSEKAQKVLKALYNYDGVATISQISKSTGLVWSSIRSTLYGAKMTKYTGYSTDEEPDINGRRQTTVKLTPSGRAYCENNF